MLLLAIVDTLVCCVDCLVFESVVFLMFVDLWLFYLFDIVVTWDCLLWLFILLLGCSVDLCLSVCLCIICVLTYW